MLCSCVRFARAIAFGCLATVAAAAPASAQDQARDPWEQGRFRIGPLSFTPAVAVRDVGWDTNVFYESEDPKEDFTARGSASVSWWLRAGGLRLIGTDSVDALYYREYESERGVSHGHTLRPEYRFNRLLLYASGSYASIKDRPGYEIDARARHEQTSAGAGFDVRFGGKTHLDLFAHQTTSRFAGDEEFEGTSLASTLNRRSDHASATFRYDLTKLTAFVVLGEVGRERFDESSERNNESFRIMPGFDFDQFALLKGKARVGYRRFNALSPAIPDFEGVVAEVDLAYVLLGRTRFGVQVDRDIQFSYEADQPYYLLTSVRGSIRQGLGAGLQL